jgi:hypothetical protein
MWDIIYCTVYVYSILLMKWIWISNLQNIYKIERIVWLKENCCVYKMCEMAFFITLLENQLYISSQ